VQGLTITDNDRKQMMESYNELLGERQMVTHLFG
jgi:hypothetical protein